MNETAARLGAFQPKRVSSSMASASLFVLASLFMTGCGNASPIEKLPLPVPASMSPSQQSKS
ncbi:MAG: hypothetical protein A2018_03965 [Alphaproteobacteria bacterium GWF2_58_20]|nr:MAG: hypothetical protein A2018_03965 [Alphaproteobacteria bacterium GWF2_58_20]